MGPGGSGFLRVSGSGGGKGRFPVRKRVSQSANGVSMPANGICRATGGACKAANGLSQSGVGVCGFADGVCRPAIGRRQREGASKCRFSLLTQGSKRARLRCVKHPTPPRRFAVSRSTAKESQDKVFTL